MSNIAPITIQVESRVRYYLVFDIHEAFSSSSKLELLQLSPEDEDRFLKIGQEIEAANEDYRKLIEINPSMQPRYLEMLRAAICQLDRRIKSLNIPNLR